LKEESKHPISRKPEAPAVERAPKQSPGLTNGADTNRQARNQAAIGLLREWMADDSGYDAKVWPSLRNAIERNRLSYRKRFGD
jgi:hypothetical protein